LYEAKGWKFHPETVEQCEREAFTDSLKSQFNDKGGCRIYGVLELNKASGHFLIAPHKHLEEAGTTGLFDILELISFTFSQFNISHSINSLSFGDTFPGIKSPLDGQVRVIEDTHGMHQYYVKIVPTVYKTVSGQSIVSNQYAVTEHLRHLSPGSGRGFPGLYFYYEISPIQATFEERRGSKGGFVRFLTNVCAIVGGSFTVMGLVDSFIATIMKFSGKTLI
jgi:hypothetical protein